MKHSHILAVILCLIFLSSCRKVSLDFSYAPAAPVVGETVTFTNLSEGGQDYTWNFGDNQTATTKNTSHAYKQPGTYIVTLRSKKTDKICQHSITVGNLSPIISASLDTIQTFVPIRFSAKYWNPYEHNLRYQWTLGDDVVLTEGLLSDTAITVYFAREGKFTISLSLEDNGVTLTTENEYVVGNNAAPALLIKTSQGSYCQRLYMPLFESPQLLTYTRGEELLNMVQNTLLAKDTMDRKVYGAGDDGLHIYNANGSDSVCITSTPVTAITICSSLNMLFYAAESEGVYMLPMIHSANNRYTNTPVQINNLTQVSVLAVDEQPF